MSVLTEPLKEDYIIGPDTMLILPVFINGHLCSKVIEMNQEVICSCSPLDIIKISCIYYGSSFAGRKEATIALTNNRNKTPIIISEILSLYYFPTTSVNKPDCMWISMKHVLYYKKAPQNTCLITFYNKINYKLDVSSHIFNNQMLKTSHLKNLVTRRLEETLEYKNVQWQYANLKELMAFERVNTYHFGKEK